MSMYLYLRVLLDNRGGAALWRVLLGDGWISAGGEEGPSRLCRGMCLTMFGLFTQQFSEYQRYSYTSMRVRTSTHSLVLYEKM